MKSKYLLLIILHKISDVDHAPLKNHVIRVGFIYLSGLNWVWVQNISGEVYMHNILSIVSPVMAQVENAQLVT